MKKQNHPKVVDQSEWQKELDLQIEREKELTRYGDKVSAQRRRLPMYKVEKDYAFEAEDGSKSLLDLFEGRKQLIVYHFMYHPDWEQGCPGCSWVTDAMSHPSHLNAVDVSFVIIGRAKIEKLLAYKKRMGWGQKWASSFGTDFNYDFNAIDSEGDENHGLSVFLRKEDEIFRTYHTGNRGVEHLGSHWSYLDLTPYGRQEEWEDSPEGWPQQKTYSFIQRHDEYKS